MVNRSPVRLLWLAILISVVVRGAMLFGSSDAFGEDPDAYRVLAVGLSESGILGLPGEGQPVHPTAFRPPLYPVLLSWMAKNGTIPPWRIGAFHLLLAASCCVMVFVTTAKLLRLTWRNLDDRSANRLSCAASVLVTLDPILVRQSSQIMTETLAATLAASVLWMWARWLDGNATPQALRRAITLGVLLGLAYLCRPPFLVWGLLLTAGMWFATTEKLKRRTAVVTFLLVATAVAGWTLRNRVVMGHPMWATSHGGYTLLLANNESIYEHIRNSSIGSIWDAKHFLNAYSHRHEADPRRAEFWTRSWNDPPSFDPNIDEYEDDRLCFDAAVATIRRNPATFLASSVIRLGRLWSPIPHASQGRSRFGIAAVASFYSAVYVAILIALIRHRSKLFRSPWWAIWLLVVAFSGVHSVYWSNLRMRAPAIPAMAMLAATAFVRNHPQED